MGLPLDALDTVNPWWLPQLDTNSGTVSSPLDDDDLSTPHYKDRCIKSHNYPFRDTPIAHRCPSILPLHLLVPHNETTDLGFGPGQIVEEHKGWYCTQCGALNRVNMMRHRRCSSSFCASTNPEKPQHGSGYALPLTCIRTPHETLPVHLPVNTLPFGVDEPTIVTWHDGMMVLRYVLAAHPPAVSALQVDQPPPRPWDRAGEVSARHIFTGNAPSLQLEATELLDSIQTGCELVRESIDSPYFSHTAVVPETTWPDCLTRAREVIAQKIKAYICKGEEGTSIQRLLVTGWMDSGSRRVRFSPRGFTQ